MRPSLSVNGKTRNAWIENCPVPEYGDGTNAGCVLVGEFRIELHTDSSMLSVLLLHETNKGPVPHATAKIKIATGAIPVAGGADTSGRFVFPLKDRIEVVKIDAVGCR